MRLRRKRWLAAGVAAVIAAGTGLGAWLLTQGPTLVFDRAQARAMLPSITAYLQSPVYRNLNGEYSSADYLTKRARWFCNEGIVEIRPAGGEWRVGMDVACGDYVRHGSQVIMADGGDMGHEVMTLSGGHGRYRVLSAAQEPGVSPDPTWIEQNFSALAAAEINNAGGPMAPMPGSNVPRAFGCGPGAGGSMIFFATGSNWGWPCASA